MFGRFEIWPRGFSHLIKYYYPTIPKVNMVYGCFSFRKPPFIFPVLLWFGILVTTSEPWGSCFFQGLNACSTCGLTEKHSGPGQLDMWCQVCTGLSIRFLMFFSVKYLFMYLLLQLSRCKCQIIQYMIGTIIVHFADVGETTSIHTCNKLQAWTWNDALIWALWGPVLWGSACKQALANEEARNLQNKILCHELGEFSSSGKSTSSSSGTWLEGKTFSRKHLISQHSHLTSNSNTFFFCKPFWHLAVVSQADISSITCDWNSITPMVLHREVSLCASKEGVDGYFELSQSWTSQLICTFYTTHSRKHVDVGCDFLENMLPGDESFGK